MKQKFLVGYISKGFPKSDSRKKRYLAIALSKSGKYPKIRIEVSSPTKISSQVLLQEAYIKAGYTIKVWVEV